jgi:hypothetical protein
MGNESNVGVSDVERYVAETQGAQQVGLVDVTVKGAGVRESKLSESVTFGNEIFLDVWNIAEEIRVSKKIQDFVRSGHWMSRVWNVFEGGEYEVLFGYYAL